MSLYLIANGASPTTASQVVVATGTNIKTMLQVKSSTTKTFKVVEWGISFEGEAAAQPIICELLETGTVFATVTAHVQAGIVKLDAEAIADANQTTNLLPVGTSATGYTSSSEGSVVATRMFDIQMVAPTNQYIKQFPLGLEPVVAVASALRIRVKAANDENAYCYVIVKV